MPNIRSEDLVKQFSTTALHIWSQTTFKNYEITWTILHGVIGMFHLRNPSGRTIALTLPQPLRELSASDVQWGVKTAGVQD